MMDDLQHQKLIVDFFNSRYEVERSITFVNKLEFFPFQEVAALGWSPDDHGADLVKS